jgi:cytidyltransferase-like protein
MELMEMNISESLIREIQKGLLQWYDFKSDAIVLYIETKTVVLTEAVEYQEDLEADVLEGTVPGALTENTMTALPEALAEMLTERSLQLVCASLEQVCSEKWQQDHMNIFDYIISIEALERHPDPENNLHVWRGLLKPDGRLLLGMNNRFGIRYFCGDRDPYTDRNFDGVEGYRRAYSKKEDTFQGCMYNQAEIARMLRSTGWNSFRFFSVFPDLKNPCLIYGEDYLPNEDLANRVFPVYNCPSTVFLEEESLYADLIENGMFHKMANAYLVECALDGRLSDVSHVTGSMERGRENALFTVIHKSGIVEKRAVYPEGRKRLEKLIEHGRDLSEHGISVVDGRLEEDVYVMPYVSAEVGQVYLKRLLQTDLGKFLEEMDRFRDLILQSSEIVKSETRKEEDDGLILRRGYLDMVPLNSFYINGTFVFYDQEFCEENYPANAIITRIIATFYAGNLEFQKFLSMEKLFERYGLMPKLGHWRKMEWEFLVKLRNEKALSSYHVECRRNGDVVNANRQRMNYSQEDYQQLFIDVFRNADTRKLILFGSGVFTKRFLALYRQDYPVYAIIDNSREKWGQELEGITIQSPDILRDLTSGEYKVLICIKNYLSVMKQLDAMGVVEYSIFDIHKNYPRKRKPIVQMQNTAEEKAALKKYHIGYIAGVFDLFHVGHLNMFKRAKEQCDYLIVGVVTDEGVRKFKETEAFVPYEERVEMVRSCRYVDEVAEIPLNFGGTSDAWRLHHFDCQFSGSDYVDNPDWLAEKEFLEKHGAEMVFFPYTESTSSSKLKAMIEKKLL